MFEINQSDFQFVITQYFMIFSSIAINSKWTQFEIDSNEKCTYQLIYMFEESSDEKLSLVYTSHPEPLRNR